MCLRPGQQAAALLLILNRLQSRGLPLLLLEREYRDVPIFVVAPCPQRSRAVGVVKTEVMVAVVHSTEGTLLLMLECFTSGWPCFRCVCQLFTANMLWGE